MLKPGLASMTFRGKTPAELIDLVKGAGLSAIEWAGDSHVPAGDVKIAREVRDMTVSAGLECSSYGSYYRLGKGAEFEPVLESALELGVSDIRIWSGGEGSLETDEKRREELVDEAKKISKLAGAEGVRISTECHQHTLTDRLESHLKLLDEVGEPNFLTYWQAIPTLPQAELEESLRAIYNTGKLTNIHIHSFDEERRLVMIKDGRIDWVSCLDIVRKDDRDRYVLIESVQDGADESFMCDAKKLLELLK